MTDLIEYEITQNFALFLGISIGEMLFVNRNAGRAMTQLSGLQLMLTMK